MRRNIILIIATIFILTGCRKEWDEHYNTPPETVDRNMWEVIKEDPNLKEYVKAMEAFQFDSLFEKNKTYTLFIPNDEAFQSFLGEDTVTESVLNYHISAHYVQSSNIDGAEKIQMLAEKYVLFEKKNVASLFDGIPLELESPLYKNGKFYVMSEVARPRPSIFEFFAENNPFLKQYILDHDSIILDKEESRPIGFDEDGNTEYDTVSTIYNEFETDFFPIREEFRRKSATLVFPSGDDYKNALNVMADALGEDYIDYNDIPIEWQYEVLIPYLLKRGVFENELDESDFVHSDIITDSLRIKNIQGDTVVIEYDVANKVMCSNGVSFNYETFDIPDTLFKGASRVEGEWLTLETGIDKYSWDETLVTVNSSEIFAPYQQYIPTASNDSILRVIFDENFAGTFDLEVKVKNIFPRKYLMVVRTQINYGGLFEVYLNGDLTNTIDYQKYQLYDYYWSVVPGSRYFKEPQGFSYWDAWADNDAPYGDAVIRIEYKGPREYVPNEGLVIDYIDFIPYNE